MGPMAAAVTAITATTNNMMAAPRRAPIPYARIPAEWRDRRVTSSPLSTSSDRPFTYTTAREVRSPRVGRPPLTVRHRPWQ